MRKPAMVLAFLTVALCGIAVAQKKPGTTTVKINTVEGQPVEYVFNPVSIHIDKTVPWQKSSKSSGDEPVLEFTSGDGKSLSMELLFDTFEEKGDVHKQFIAPMDKLMAVDPALKRPPMVTFTWGSDLKFSGVVDSMGVQYTMFAQDGTPTRATVNLSLKSASKAETKSDDDDQSKP